MKTILSLAALILSPILVNAAHAAETTQCYGLSSSEVKKILVGKICVHTKNEKDLSNKDQQDGTQVAGTVLA